VLIPQVSTKSATRHKEAPRIAEIISRVCELKLGHYLICFPSFEFANNVSQQIQSETFKIWVQRRDTKNADIDALMDSLRGVTQPTLLFAVQGGQLAEGLDYTDIHLKGVIVVGPGLPAFDYENELLRQHFDLTDKAGFQFAYVIPAMTRVIQSAGRLIRNPDDRGLIVLIDNRFLDLQYAGMMPHGWYNDTPQELVPTRLLQQVEDFWRETNAPKSSREEEHEVPLL
jgi:DNA excision repair protein ERCC-2